MGVAVSLFVCYNAPKGGIPILAPVRTLGLYFWLLPRVKKHFAQGQSIF